MAGMTYRHRAHNQSMIEVKHFPEFAEHKGCIVALSIPKEIGKQIAVEGGLPPSELHITLCYFGKLKDNPEEKLYAMVRELALLAAFHPVLKGDISGSGRFCGVEGDKDAAYLSFDSPTIPEFRRSVKQITDKYVSVSDLHGFTPHITLAYVAPEERHPRERLQAIAVEFNTLEVWAGATHFILPLGSSHGEQSPQAMRAARNRIAQADLTLQKADQPEPQQEPENLGMKARGLLADLTGSMFQNHLAERNISRRVDELHAHFSQQAAGLGNAIPLPRGSAVETAYLEKVREGHILNNI